jgi:putative transcriptional regulator
MNSLQGTFLVAAPHQLDPNFVKATVLVVAHTVRGALGIIVNDYRRESGIFQRRNSRWDFRRRIGLCYGGPVTGPLMAIHTNAILAERQIMPGVFFSARKELMLRLMRQLQHPCKIFSGYAGWSPGQLGYELEQGVWRVVPATAQQIFSHDGNLWEKLSMQATRLQLWMMFNIKHVPADPLLN